VSDVPSRSEGRLDHLAQLRGAAVATLVLIVLCGVIFPAAVWAIAQLFPENAHGSLVFSDGAPRGSRLIGQAFRSAHYFHGRPSAAGDGYDATLSGGTNLATDNPKQLALLDELMLAGEYYRRTADLELVRALWPNLHSALQWIECYGDHRVTRSGARAARPHRRRALSMKNTCRS
jgi:hypothetical protein